MGVTVSRAFGAYMRQLRERQGLSAPAVCRLLEDTSERLDRGSLWRLEHGEHGLSMGKLTLLGRIYGVSAEVLAERLELDRELDHIGGPDTADLSLDELVERGRRTLSGRGSKWDAYAYFRDASAHPQVGERAARVRLNLAVAMRSLGKNRLALHELQALEPTVRSAALHAVVLDRIANCQRCLGDLDAAQRTATEALAEAEGRGDGRVSAFAHSSLANIAMARRNHTAAVDHLQQALRTSRRPGSANSTLRPSPAFEVTTLNMLAECYLRTDRPEQAKLAATSARKTALRYRFKLGLAHSELSLGVVDEVEGRPGRAEQRWRRVLSIADAIGDHRLSFAGEFYIFRRALRAGEASRAMACRRRLERLAPWVPGHVPLVREFHEMIHNGEKRSRARQRRRRELENPI